MRKISREDHEPDLILLGHWQHVEDQDKSDEELVRLFESPPRAAVVRLVGRRTKYANEGGGRGSSNA